MELLQLQKLTNTKFRQWRHALFLMLFCSVSLLSCSKKSQCPIYWEGTDNSGGGKSAAGGADKTDWKVETNATKPADGGGEGEQSAGSGDPETTAEFPMVRVKRDKNGIVSKKAMPRNKVKRTDPRKSYKGT